MKKPILIGVTALGVVLLVFVSCLHDPDFGNGGDKDTKSSGRLTKEEAQSEFERHFAAQVKTRSGSDSKGDLLVDFDYTPLWYNGKLEHNDYSSLMTVPILTDRVMYVGYYGDGGEKPTRVARVTQELHIVKNFEKDIVMPTVKTVVPLNGIVFRSNMRALEIDDYYSNRTEVTFYQTLDGRIITTKLIENGVVTVIAFVGEDAESYHEKMSRVYSKLHGYGYKIGKKRIATRSIEDDNDSGSSDSDKMRCLTCQKEFSLFSFDRHQCKCPWCKNTFIKSDLHKCPPDNPICECGVPNCTYPHEQEIGINGFRCSNCKNIFLTEQKRAFHLCYCVTCNGNYQFYSEFNPHVCKPICALCKNNPCTCGSTPGENIGGGNPNPDPNPNPNPDPQQDGNKGKNSDLPKKKPKEPKEDCAGYKDAREQTDSLFRMLKELLADTAVYESIPRPSFQDFLDAVDQQPDIEHSLTIDTYYDSYIAHGDINHGTSNSVIVNTGRHSFADIHNHPNNSPPSPLDMWRIVSIAADPGFPNFQTGYVYTSDGYYCIHVTNRQKAANFVSNYSIADVIDSGTNDFNKKSVFYDDYYNARNKFSNLGENDAWCHALSYIADKYGMGVVVMRQKKKENGEEEAPDDFETKHVTKDEDGKYWPARCK